MIEEHAQHDVHACVFPNINFLDEQIRNQVHMKHAYGVQKTLVIPTAKR